MKLYHFSEEAGIEDFEPRVKANRRNMPPVVWAIDEEHEFTFFFPRNCPRIVYAKSNDMSDADRDRFFGCTEASVVVTLEARWYERLMNTTLYRYELPAQTFQMFDETAGYHISLETVKPLEKTAISNGLERLTGMNIDIRFTPNLHPLREAILQSSIKDFGIHRFDFASRL